MTGLDDFAGEDTGGGLERIMVRVVNDGAGTIYDVDDSEHVLTEGSKHTLTETVAAPLLEKGFVERVEGNGQLGADSTEDVGTAAEEPDDSDAGDIDETEPEPAAESDGGDSSGPVDWAVEHRGTRLDNAINLTALLEALGVDEKERKALDDDESDEDLLDRERDTALAGAIWRCIKASGFEIREVEETAELWRYDTESGLWRDTGDRLVGELARQMLGPDRYGKNIKRELLAEIGGDPDIVIAEGDLGVDVGLFPVDNGILDLETRELRAATPEDYLTERAGVEYDPDATCPRWDAFIDDVVRSGSHRKKLQEYAGYVLWHGEMPHHKTLFIPGPENSGKSTFIETISKLVPESRVSAAEPHDLTKRFGKWALYGTWLNVSSDIGERMINNLGTFKQLTGEDRVRADRKYKDPVEFHPTAKHIFSANELPDPFNADDAFWRRVLIVPFPETVPREDRDPALKRDLEGELSGILNWALDGLDRLRENGSFTADRVTEETRRKWEIWGTPVVRFRSRLLRDEPGAETLLDDLYNAYRTFCRENGFHVLSKSDFGKKLLRYPHISQDRTTSRPKQRVYLNIKLRDE